MPISPCVDTRTFPCVLNSSLFKCAKKDTLLWVTDTEKKNNRPKHTGEVGRERDELGYPEVPGELQSDSTHRIP